MKNKSRKAIKGFVIIFTILTFLMLSLNGISQINQYSFKNMGTTEAYLTIDYCRTLNYYWDQGLIDRQGNIYFVFVDNYKLFYFKSVDKGQNWTKTQVVTPQDGKIYTAMAALTQKDSLVFVYSVNTGFNNGNVGFGSEFIYDVYGAVQTQQGWNISTLYTHTTNSGLLPYGTITVKSGKVHVILYKYGWYNYGGELHEVVYDPTVKSWSSIATIKIFNDRSVDHSTFHVCKLAEGANDTIICVYQRHAASTSNNNLEVVMKGAGGWTEPHVILANNNYSTYNRFDLDYDRHGHFYLGYFIPYGPDGPEIYMAHNSVKNFTKYTPFQTTDTLRKISIHPYPDAEAYVYLNFKDSYPKIMNYSQDGLLPTNYLPGFTQQDSVDVMRFHYQIPLKNNFSDSVGLFSFTNRYMGKEGNTVLSYPIVYVSANLKKVIPAAREDFNSEKEFSVYPNPGNGTLYFKTEHGNRIGRIQIYNSLGRMVKSIDLEERNSADISDLPPALYIIRVEDKPYSIKYLKK